jgi:hypothetical protein
VLKVQELRTKVVTRRRPDLYDYATNICSSHTDKLKDGEGTVCVPRERLGGRHSEIRQKFTETSRTCLIG